MGLAGVAVGATSGVECRPGVIHLSHPFSQSEQNFWSSSPDSPGIPRKMVTKSGPRIAQKSGSPRGEKSQKLESGADAGADAGANGSHSNQSDPVNSADHGKSTTISRWNFFFLFCPSGLVRTWIFFSVQSLFIVNLHASKKRHINGNQPGANEQAKLEINCG